MIWLVMDLNQSKATVSRVNYSCDNCDNGKHSA